VKRKKKGDENLTAKPIYNLAAAKGVLTRIEIQLPPLRQKNLARLCPMIMSLQLPINILHYGTGKICDKSDVIFSHRYTQRNKQP